MIPTASIVAGGNGAFIVHRLLEQNLDRYQLQTADPYVAAAPPLYRRLSKTVFQDAALAHVIADYGEAELPQDCRCIASFHNIYIDEDHVRRSSWLRQRYYRQVMTPAIQRSLRQADQVVVVSRFLADQVRKLGTQKPLEVIYNGIDTDRFQPATTSQSGRKLRVLFVGNPSKRKGFDLLAGIAAALPDNVELAYTGGLRNTSHRRHPRLIALGSVPYTEMPEIYQQADVLLFPTQREGFGLCVAEAMACGLPVVSTRTSALPELIDQGRGGWLCDPDDIEGMIHALRRLLCNSALRHDQGAWNRERALKDFTLPRMVSDYRALFAQVADRSPHT
jgi:glycosyltransferase involved in cell wall biosynthesis